MLRRINDGLPGLVAGIVIWGLLVQLTGVWFVADKWRYSVGLWYGAAIAIGMAINMAQVLYDAMSFAEEGKIDKRVVAKSGLRYIVVAVLFGILGYFEFGNIFTAFLGAMGLKVSAYMQPLLMWIVHKLTGRDDAASFDDNSEKINEEVTM